MKNTSIVFENSSPSANSVLTPVQSGLARAIKSNLKESALNEGSTADVAIYQNLLRAVIERTESDSVLPLISSYVPASTPSGKIPVVLVKYIGKDEAVSAATILQVADTTGFVVGGQISAAGGVATGNVLYVESGLILVQTLTGAWSAGIAIDNVTPYVAAQTTIVKTLSNIAKAGTIFRNYSGTYATNDAEILTNTQKNKFRAELHQIDYTAKTKTISTGFTLEAIQDIMAVYPDGYNKITSAISNIVMQEVEQSYIEWLKTIAPQTSDVSLIASLGMASGIRDTYTDILGRINTAIGNIRQNTSLDGAWFIIASPRVTQALRTIDLITNTKTDLVNSKYIGTHITGGFQMIEDCYAMDDYVIVGHAGIKGYDSGGGIFIPYNIDIVHATDPITLQEQIGVKVRYDYVRSPLDTHTSSTGVGGDCDFFEYFKVTGFTDIPNF